MEIKKTPTIFFVLILLLVVAVGYIAYDKTTEFQNAKQIEAYQTGYQQGAISAIGNIAVTAANCKEVPLYVENQTVVVVSVDCVNAMLQQQAQQTQQ